MKMNPTCLIFQTVVLTLNVNHVVEFFYHTLVACMFELYCIILYTECNKNDERIHLCYNSPPLLLRKSNKSLKDLGKGYFYKS